MPFFDGSSRSRSTSVVTNTDRRIAAQDEATVISGGTTATGGGQAFNLNVNTGGKASRSNLTLINESADAEVIRTALEETLSFSDKFAERQAAQANSALDLARLTVEEAESEAGKSFDALLKNITIIAVVGAAAWAFRRGIK